MGVCSYCRKYRTQDEECFGWEEARNYCGVEKPTRAAVSGLDAVDLDMIRHGDMLGPALGRRVFDLLIKPAPADVAEVVERAREEADYLEVQNASPLSTPMTLRDLASILTRVAAERDEALVQLEVENASRDFYCEICGSCGSVGCGCEHKCKYSLSHPDAVKVVDELTARATAAEAALAEARDMLRDCIEQPS